MKCFTFLVWCAVSVSVHFGETCMLNPVLQRLGNQVSELKELRRVAVEQVRRLDEQLTQELARDNHKAVKILLDKLDGELWPRVVQLSEEIFDTAELISESAQEMEDAYEEELNALVAGILFKAKVRKCPSLDEAFYSQTKSCVKINSHEENPCKWKENQLLYEVDRNEGMCDCNEEDESLVYYMKDGHCYRLNTQGPCQFGQWITFHQGVPSCRPVPAGCRADGDHVFGTIENTTGTAACHALHEQGPCAETERLERTGHGVIVCKSKDGPTHALIPMRRPSIKVRPLAGIDIARGNCPVGSFRYQTKRCRR